MYLVISCLVIFVAPGALDKFITEIDNSKPEIAFAHFEN